MSQEVRLEVLKLAAERRDLEPQAIVERAKVFEAYVLGQEHPGTAKVVPMPDKVKAPGRK